MPYLISRQDALDSISNELDTGECLACMILNNNSEYIIKKGEFTTSVLSKYPRTWGQTMVILNSHKTLIQETTKNEWNELMTEIKELSILIENNLKPLRTYISCLGATENLPNTCPHIHFNIIPIYNSTDKPSEIFTWEKGVYQGTEEEWHKLINTLKK